MAEARVKTALWVSATLRAANAAGQMGAVLRHRDDDAGGVLAVLRTREGLVVLTQTLTATGDHAWLRGTGPQAVDEAGADAYVNRQVARDPDLWVVEFETPDGVPPFSATIL